MSFISAKYLLFLAIIVLAYWRLSMRSRVWLLLLGSCIFYGAWDVRFLALLGASSVIDFFCGLAIQDARRPLSEVVGLSSIPLLCLAGCAAYAQGGAVAREPLVAAGAFFIVFPVLYEWLWLRPDVQRKRAFFLFSVFSNLGVLCFFKYFGFFVQNISALAQALGFEVGPVLLSVTLPIAVSFYTFQSICYATDIYRNKAHAINDFVTFAAYLSFFPQLVAGPIERPSNLVPQFEKEHQFKVEDLHEAARLLFIGFFKKIFVADNCAIIANHVFDPQTSLNAPWAILGAIAFAFQIYGDFSGYTDIARGSALLFGFRLSQNFHFPYFATGPSDFWRRWHITLSTWFRDYVYIPLGGNKVSSWRMHLNLWLTMLAAGLWHGAQWTYVAWGAFHGSILVLYKTIPTLVALENAKTGWRLALATGLMFCVTCVGWVIFRSSNFSSCLSWFQALGQWGSTGVSWKGPLLWLAVHCLPLVLLQVATRNRSDESSFPASWNWAVNGLIYALVFLLISSSAISEKEFLYFQF